jgi:hypothetical protein
VPKEKYDWSDVILEVTSGRTTGGQRAMYCKRVLETEFYPELTSLSLEKPAACVYFRTCPFPGCSRLRMVLINICAY